MLSDFVGKKAAVVHSRWGASPTSARVWFVVCFSPTSSSRLCALAVTVLSYVDTSLDIFP